MSKPTKQQVSEAMKILAACRDPKNMKRGDSDYYRQLAARSHKQRTKKISHN